jgi:2-polyprenyl-3-methyl-5-hydroxy-6-metoxy-1,4-benzoquinol methylase
MNGKAYYSFQAQARGLTSDADVEALTQQLSPCYDRLIASWLPSDPNAAIYELACGPGIMLRYLRRRGYSHVAGSDSSEPQIKLASAAGLNVVLADSILELKKGPSQAWDCLIAIDFIEHLPKDLFIEFLGQCYRALRPGGRLVLRAPNGDSPFVGKNLFNDITHIWAYTSIATEALVRMAGFKKVEFADESCAGIQRHRWIKLPLMKLSQRLLRFLIRSATREEIPFLNPSIYVCAFK